ncbi:4-alpha-glucanotransferase [Streptococcus sanguinis SK1 = NCTC 7863]|jgi:4-alpha-glucanotransferase|uniref:4-alpha-glucanotransferase n=1 Tax=Streptococcus sanguinis SK405 TaxID=888817 RepID=A0ABC9PCE6_STRSA|nr:4-alpha-glucanotransferase [Streptococcus sanguinis]EGC24582.1 4-alpha-glucanotransferase [Streptococcus sanguinis SK405]EGC27721.1 4-alpha-glucanotransferase [Streptococcus sanguinis SK678]EGF06403.1 4-alpha-glucanotransferase [Streptococcus sanguinis SK1 = NCTC 7863]MBZ2075360.1 4-alpha-glucanotransferase [Streptococcus sanguinis]MCY7013897.1 4-alpha-glucanotransferase [Streptococcus sanguinis]
MKKRQSGVLMHISSLPGKYGIGSFGQSAYDFVDFLVRTKQRYWQILPLGTTSYGDSPYQSFSAFAGNTYFIDFDILIEEGLLNESDVKGADFGDDPRKVDYAKIFDARRPIMEKAVARFLKADDLSDYESFVEQNAAWLEVFAEYMAIKEHFDNLAWTEWPDEAIRRREAASLASYREKLADKLTYHRVTQYLFFKQWLRLKAYANEHHIEIVGDMPIYVAADSADVWAQPHFFKTDAVGKPTCVAGCPPDEFSETGQLWGNPIYDWEAMDKDGYAWWIERLRESFKIYDIVRIDHFRGFESYWEVPAGSETSASGKWVKGPDYKLFAAVKEALGDLNIIAEDLGFMTDEVIELRERTGFPGMKILQFAFNPDDESIDSPHLAPNNSVMYTGTHDNNTVLGWYKDEIDDATRQYMAQYTNRKEYETVPHAMLRTIFASVSFMAIATMQDLLELDSAARMNYPSTIGGNWTWRMTAEELNPIVEGELYSLTKTYRRMNTDLINE